MSKRAPVSRQTPGDVRKLEARRNIGGLLEMVHAPGVEDDPKLRRRIASSLLSLCDPSSVQGLIGMARDDPDENVKLLSLYALAKIGDRAAVPFLIETLVNGEVGAGRLHAIHGLGQSCANEAVGPLIAALTDSKAIVRAAAAQALADIGERLSEIS